MIDIITPLTTAYQRTEAILFKPFIFEKWCAIGFAAFLIQPFNTGVGQNFANQAQSHQQNSTSVPLSADAFASNGMANVWLSPIFIIIMIFALTIGLIIGIGLLWLQARGHFMLISNIVRNEGKISAPWSRYGKQANQLFFFLLGWVFFILFYLALILSPIIVLVISSGTDHSGNFFGLLVFYGLIAFFLYLPVIFFYQLFIEFGIPLMFRNGLTPWAAFKKSIGLFLKEPLALILMGLLLGVLFLAFVTILIVAILLTCCILGCFLIIPYIGAVILLPFTVYFRCYLYDVLAQFGPEYDIWTVDHSSPPPAPYPYYSA